MAVPTPSAWSPIALVAGIAGAVALVIGFIVYRSNPYYNNTTDPIGIGFMVVGGVLVLVAWLAQSAWRKARRAELVANDIADAKARAAAVAPEAGEE
jgi:multisubunit Na+/H+ antiporter MnhB subunit